MHLALGPGDWRRLVRLAFWNITQTMKPDEDIVCRAIGVVRSPYPGTTEVLIQTAGVPAETAELEVYEAFAPGLGWFGPRLGKLPATRSDDRMGGPPSAER